MKKLALIAVAGMIALGSCGKEDEEDDKPSAYQGEWEFESEQGDFDTTFTTSINAKGNFSYEVTVQQFAVKVSGNVDEKGSLDGDIGSGGITVGRMTGTLKSSGTGSGNYIALGDTIAWEAQRK